MLSGQLSLQNLRNCITGQNKIIYRSFSLRTGHHRVIVFLDFPRLARVVNRPLTVGWSFLYTYTARVVNSPLTVGWSFLYTYTARVVNSPLTIVLSFLYTYTARVVNSLLTVGWSFLYTHCTDEPDFS